MPLFKNALTRYYLINECFTHPRKRYWTLEEIIEKAGKRDILVSKRTLEHDLYAMRYDERLQYQAPIAYCKKNKGFHYTDAGYSIERLPLTEADIETFDIMVQAFQRFKGAQVLQQVEGMFDKLGKVAEHLKHKSTKAPYPVVAFEQIPYSRGMLHFDVLHQAILKQKPLLIAYKKFDHEIAKEHVFHPYLLKEYKFRWYLLGYSEKRKGKLILALDRIESISTKKTPFKPYKGNDLQHYFDHTLGVTITTGSIQEIRLWFSPSQGNYIKTQYLHATQEIISDDTGGLVVTLQLLPNYELLQTLLSFGPEVKVLQPQSLRDELKQMLEKSLGLYGKTVL